MSKEKTPLEYNINKGQRRSKWDVALLGLILGIIFPCIGLLLLYWLQWQDLSFSQYVGKFTNTGSSLGMKAASKLVSLAIIFNLIPFYFFLNKKAMQTVRGVVIASALALLLVVFYLFVWQ